MDTIKQTQEDFFKSIELKVNGFIAELLAYPDSKITGLVLDRENLLGDTACFRSDNGKVVVSVQLLQALEVALGAKAVGAITMVLRHEAWHSSYTKAWLTETDGTPSKAYLLNHLEDWRNHKFQVTFWPSCKVDINNLYTALELYRTSNEKKALDAQSPEAKAYVEKAKASRDALDKNTKETIQVREEIVKIWDTISKKSAFSNFEDQVEAVITKGNWHKTTVGLINRALPHMSNFRNAQPSPFDRRGIMEASLLALSEAHKIFEIFDPFFDFKKETEAMKGMTVDEAIKQIEEELKDREKEEPEQGQPEPEQGQPEPGQGQPQPGQGQPQPGQGQPQPGQGQPQPGQGQPQPGQGQPQPGQGESSKQNPSAQAEKVISNGQFKGIAKEELEQLLKVLKELKDMANGGAQPDAEKISEDEIETEREKIGDQKRKETANANKLELGVGYSSGSGAARDVPTDPIDERIYKNFILDNAGLIRYLKRLMANAKNNQMMERSHKTVEGKRGNRIRIRGVIDHLSAPSEESKILWQREGSPSKGKSMLVLEDLLIAVDGSGSMQGIKGIMSILLALICEASKDVHIPTSIVISYDGTPEILTDGRRSSQHAKAIRQLLNISPDGGTDMGNGSLGTLAKLRRKGSNTEMSRLVIVTDCCTSAHDLRTVAKYSEDIGYPTCVLGLGTNASNASTVLNHMPKSSVICYDTRKITNEALYKYLYSFCEWMSDPEEYKRRAKGEPQLLSEFSDKIRAPKDSLLNGLTFK